MRPIPPVPRPRATRSEALARRAALDDAIVGCRACPRLVAWREEVARTRRRMFRDEDYWGKPVPGFGDLSAPIAIVGLAPAAHGANRTGRIFTGDRSGDFLFAALHRAGLANQPTSTARNDGLVLRGVFIVGTLRCAPPDNRPLPDEVARCAPFLDRELALLPGIRVVVALGAIAWDAYLAHAARLGDGRPKPRPRFGHGASWIQPGSGRILLGSYHVSQQNTQTGRLTPSMLDGVLEEASRKARGGPREASSSNRLVKPYRPNH